MTALTIAGLTLREASRRRVVWALAGADRGAARAQRLGLLEAGGLDTDLGTMTSGEARLVASQLLNLVMFGFSLIAALGTAFLAGPDARRRGRVGQALAMLARPVRRSAVLLGKWLGLVAFGCGFVVLAGLAAVPRRPGRRSGYWPPEPVAGLALLAGADVVLLTLALLLSSVVSPMASGIVAVGLFGATWVAGVVGGDRRGAGQRRASRGWARSRGSCCPPTACGAGP